MKTVVIALVMGMMLLSCSPKTEVDIAYREQITAKLELFYRYMDSHQDSVQEIIANKFILLNKAWVRESRENLDKWYGVCKDIRELKPGPRTEDAHKILVTAMSQCQSGITEFQMFYTTLDDAYVAKSTSYMTAMTANLKKCCKILDLKTPE